MTIRSIKTHVLAAAVLLATVFLASCGASQDPGANLEADGEHSFAGKTITVVIGLDASAGGTTVGRLLAKHLEMNLAGNPTVIVNNMPGASGLNAHLHVLLRAPDDGTTVYYGPRSSLGELLELPGFTFKYSQFTPLGGVQIGGLVVYARTDATPAGVSGPRDILETEALRFGGMPPEHGRMIVSTMGLDLIGANYKYIAGYPSSGNIRAAVISGEVNTATDAAHAYLNQVVPVLVDEGLASPIFSMPMLDNDGALVQNAMVPDVPSLLDVYQALNNEAPSGIIWDSITTLLELDQTMQHVFLGPPALDAAAAETFRAGLQQAMASAAFREEAQQVLSYVPGHVDHERQAEILGATANVSPEVLEYIRSHIEKNSGY
jgi:tripartite-type tricarboxylate transporter receptor subunit TctC